MTKKQLLEILDDCSDEMVFNIVTGEDQFPLHPSMFILADDFRSFNIDITGDPATETAED